MKRIFLLIALVGMMAAGAHAQTSALVTLSHEGDLSFFEGLTSLEEALDSAKNGDILYLSEGRFGLTTSGDLVIDKNIRLVGSGYESYIMSGVQYNPQEIVSYSETAPFLESLRVESLKLSPSYTSDSISKIYIKLCRIGEVSGNMNGDITFDRCRTGRIDSPSISYARINVKNSKVYSLYHSKGSTSSTSNNVIAENCNIDLVEGYFSGKLFSCIINSTSSDCRARFENCLANIAAGANYASSYNCYTLPDGSEVLDDNYETSLDLKANGYLGIDGTPVGIYGGPWVPYSEMPEIPTVNSASSSVNYDSEKNQLNVNISMKE